MKLTTTLRVGLELHFNKKPTRVWEQYLKIQNTDDTPYKRRLFLVRERMHSHVKKGKQEKPK